MSDSFYSLKTTTLQGKPADLGQFDGKVTLVVNVASACGYTPQYKGLQALHTELAGEGFAVLGFPSHEIGGQEPGSAGGIPTFCAPDNRVAFPPLPPPVPAQSGGHSPGSAIPPKDNPPPQREPPTRPKFSTKLAI